MTNQPEIDYEAAFQELSTLNRFFEDHHNFQLPTLNPELFTYQDVEDGSDVIVQGLRSGLYFGCTRTSVPPSGNNTYFSAKYSAFQRVVPKERTIIEWVRE